MFSISRVLAVAALVAGGLGVAAVASPTARAADDDLPTLSKAFSPVLQRTGALSTLTFTITNSADLTAKSGWSFTDTLPVPLYLASSASVSTTCPNGVVNAPDRATSITASGDLAAGMESCSFSVDVTTNAADTYVNGPDNVTVTGLNPLEVPASVTFTVTDFGDAPASYETATTSHGLSVNIGIGALRDREAVASPTADATGDDLADFDDEDAFDAVPDWRADQSFTLAVPVSNTNADVQGLLVGWIDTNRDGDFADAGEQSSTNAIAPGATSADLTWPAAPAAVSGSSFVRLRLYRDPPQTVAPTGPVPTGEIEDHAITLQVARVQVTKSASAVDDRDGNGIDAGDVITYTIGVANPGTLDLDPLVVDDPLLGGVVACGGTSLAAGASRTCPSLDYTLTPADIDAGQRANRVTATGTPGSGPVVADSATVTTTLPPPASGGDPDDPSTDPSGNGGSGARGGSDGGGSPSGAAASPTEGAGGFLPDTGSPRLTLALLFAAALMLSGGVTVLGARRRRTDA